MKSKKQVLICDRCGAENLNLASEGKSHDQPANPIKGYEACSGIWRLPDQERRGVIIQFPERKETRVIEDLSYILRHYALEDGEDEQ